MSARVAELARECCVDLFATYGVDLDPTEAGADLARACCGILAFTGDGIRGAVVLAAEEPLLAACCPVDGPASRDWVGELANQLVGRLKNHLLRYGADISLGTPTVLRGHDVRPHPGTDSVWFGGPAGAARLSLQVEQEIALEEPAEAPEAGLLEGEMLLF